MRSGVSFAGSKLMLTRRSSFASAGSSALSLVKLHQHAGRVGARLRRRAAGVDETHHRDAAAREFARGGPVCPLESSNAPSAAGLMTGSV